MPNTLALFFFLLLNATHKDKKVGTTTGVIELKRGQFIAGRAMLAASLKQTEAEIRTSVARLEGLGIITKKTTSKYSVYTIENYGKYQDSEHQFNQQIASKSPANDQQITTKQECKNLRIKEKGPDKSGPITLKTFIQRCEDSKEKRIRETDAVVVFAKDAGIPSELLSLAWSEFVARHIDTQKRYKDWRLAFNNCVKANWYKLWYRTEDGQYLLSDTGKTIQAAQQQRKLREEGGDE